MLGAPRPLHFGDGWSSRSISCSDSLFQPLGVPLALSPLEARAHMWLMRAGAEHPRLQKNNNIW